jgi:hypothetical protein
MISGRIKQTIACDPSTYWRCALADDYNEQLFLSVWAYREYRLLERVDTPIEVRRRCYVTPPSASAVLERVMGPPTGYIEQLVFDKHAGAATISYELPDSLRDKLTVNAKLWCDPAGNDQTERVFELSISFRIRVLGSVLEQVAYREIERLQRAVAGFTESYLKHQARAGS